MTLDRKQMIADVFMQHWNQPQVGDQSSFSMQEAVARRLLNLGYPLNLDEEAIRKRKDEIEAFATGGREPHQSRRGVPDVPEHTDGDESRIIRDSGIITARGLRVYDYQWIAVTPDVKTSLLAELSPVDDKYRLSDATTQVDVCKLDWYDEYRLLRFMDPTWTNSRLRLYYLLGPEAELFRLNGASPPIHEVNAKAPIKLNEENVLSYLIFFCFFVRGDEGPFYLLESMDDPLLEEVRNASPENQSMWTTRAVIEGTVRPVTLEGSNEFGHYQCEGATFYSNAMFIASFSVQPTGMIEMLEDEPIAADLPFRINAPIA